MNNTFDFVHHSLLNRSKSKQTHLFNKAPRFPIPTNAYCTQSSYHLNKTMLASPQIRTDSLSKQQRFTSSATLVPSPNAYHHRSFVDMSQAEKKGSKFGRQQKFKDISKRYRVPGPSTYQSHYNPQKNLSYTMRNRVNVPDHKPNIGPGHYHVENYHTLSSSALLSSKYNNPKATKIGRAERFNKNARLTPGLGPSAYSKIRTQWNANGSAFGTFGRMMKQPSYIAKTNTPAPNYYNHFSQFSQLKGGVGSMPSLSMSQRW